MTNTIVIKNHILTKKEKANIEAGIETRNTIRKIVADSIRDGSVELITDVMKVGGIVGLGSYGYVMGFCTLVEKQIDMAKNLGTEIVDLADKLYL